MFLLFFSHTKNPICRARKQSFIIGHCLWRWNWTEKSFLTDKHNCFLYFSFLSLVRDGIQNNLFRFYGFFKLFNRRDGLSYCAYIFPHTT